MKDQGSRRNEQEVVDGGQKSAKNAAGIPTVAWLWTREVARLGERRQGKLIGDGTEPGGRRTGRGWNG